MQHKKDNLLIKSQVKTRIKEKNDTFANTMEWLIVLISWIKFTHFTTPSHKAAPKA